MSLLSRFFKRVIPPSSPWNVEFPNRKDKYGNGMTRITEAKREPSGRGFCPRCRSQVPKLTLIIERKYGARGTIPYLRWTEGYIYDCSRCGETKTLLNEKDALKTLRRYEQ